MPLGYEVVDLREARARRRPDAHRTSPPSACPSSVLDEEIDHILDMGVDIRYDTPVDEHEGAARRGLRRGLRRHRRAQGQGARHPGPRTTTRPASTSASTGSSRSRSGTSTRSASACSSSASATRPWTAAAPRGGSAARTSRSWRAGRAGTSRPRRGSSRTPRRRQVEIVVNHAPKRFVIENGKLVGHGVRAAGVDGGRRQGRSDCRSARVILPCDDVILAIGQENAFPGSSATSASSSTSGTCRWSTRPRSSARAPACSSAATRRGDRRTSSGRWSTATRPPSPSTTTARASGDRAAATGHEPRQPEDGHARVELLQRLQPVARAPKMQHVELAERFKKLEHRGRARLHRRADGARGRSAASTATSQTVFTDQACIECDACIDICPVSCLTITPNGEEAELRRSSHAPAENLEQPLYRVRGAAADRRG